MDTMRLAILEPIGILEEELRALESRYLENRVEMVIYPTREEDTKTLIERSKDADIVVLTNFRYGKEVIEHCPKLKMICVAFTGVDHIDLSYCKERGITVLNCAGYSTVAVADLVFGLIIDLYRNIIPCNDIVRKEGTKAGLIGYELEGKKFGIVGTGAIGLRVANIAKAFGCEVYAYSRTVKEGYGINYCDMDTLLGISDIISLHVPQTEETIGLINEANFEKMKANAILINTARGPVVDSNALANALKNGQIAGAGIDVFEMEPPVPSGHPLFDVPNLIATPHVAFATKESMKKRAVIVFENIDSWLRGKPQNRIV